WRDRVGAVGDHRLPVLLGRPPEAVRWRWAVRQRSGGQLDDQVAALPGVQFEVEDQMAAVCLPTTGPGPRRTRPADGHPGTAGRPGVTVAGPTVDRPTPVVTGQSQHRPDAGRRAGQRFPALHDPLLGDPPAPPDEAAVLVGPTRYPPADRAELVAAARAEETGDHRRVIPAGEAQPRQPAVGSDQCPPLAVGDEGVVTEGVWRPGWWADRHGGCLPIGGPAHVCPRYPPDGVG